MNTKMKQNMFVYKKPSFWGYINIYLLQVKNRNTSIRYENVQIYKYRHQITVSDVVPSSRLLTLNILPTFS